MRRGLLDDVEALAREAVAAGDDDLVPLFGDPRFALAEILARTGRPDEARSEAEACLRHYEAKGIVPLIQEARALSAEISEAKSGEASPGPGSSLRNDG